ncbi:MAG: hypothetical protein A2511_17375 [Deltaproteobacteria bacterium RIFOXYD12_FULL_50_9]|nr:MAG: hypothetical protein A2511_17375 [Deltaproteobacteria bacterium RIFOXYD12_FULL_50_9]
MDEGSILDIAHISFLDMIKVMIVMGGAPNAKGTLIRNAINTADRISPVAYGNFTEYLSAIDTATNPITRIEGRSTLIDGSVFGLKLCPFGPSIKNYTSLFEKLPEGYADFTAEFNKPSMVTDKFKVGEGAGVSPFCSVHQPMRSAFADKITIGGKKVKIYQLGCKSGGGKKGFADKWITESGVPRELVDKVLDDYMCCYFLKVQD